MTQVLRAASGGYAYTLLAAGADGPEARYCAPFAEPKGGRGKFK